MSTDSNTSYTRLGDVNRLMACLQSRACKLAAIVAFVLACVGTGLFGLTCYWLNVEETEKDAKHEVPADYKCHLSPMSSIVVTVVPVGFMCLVCTWVLIGRPSS